MTTNRITFRAISFVFAAMVTASMLAGIDGLARHESASNPLMAQSAVAQRA